jgi:hypothetical protein
MNEVMNAFRYLSTVRTPGGIGLVEGYQTASGQSPKVLVSHDLSAHVAKGASQPTPRVLVAYPVEVLEIMR